MPTAPPSSRPLPIKPFHRFCVGILKVNKSKSRIDVAAARYLRTCAIVAPDTFSDWAEAVKRVLLKVGRYRITKAAIRAVLENEDYGEVEWVLPTGEDLQGRPTYYLKKLLAKTKLKGGKVLYLVDWEPTWEPISNLPMAEVRKFNKEQRKLVEKTYFEVEATQSQ